MQLIGVVFFAVTIPAAAVIAERGRKRVMIAISIGIAIFGLFFAHLFEAGHTGALAMLIIGLSLMGLTYGPLGTVLSELFPTAVRYTGSSLAFSLAGILGRIAHAVHRHQARHIIWPAVCGLLSECGGDPVDPGIARYPRDEGRSSHHRDDNTMKPHL